MRKLNGVDEGTVENAYTVMDLVLLADTKENGNRLRNRGLIDDNLSETTLECGILLDVLAVFGQSRGANAA